MQCSQCQRPAMYTIEGHHLCLDHYAVLANIEFRKIAIANEGADRALDDMEMATGVPMRSLMGQKRQQPVILQGGTFHNVSISGSNVGVVNTGQLTQINSAVSVIGQQGGEQLAQALQALTNAVTVSTTLADEAKNEAVEILSALSTEGAVPPDQRRRSVARSLLGRLKEVIGTGADLLTLGQAAWPLIAAWFGIQT